MKTLNDIFAAALKASRERKDSDVYIVTSNPKLVNEKFKEYLAPYDDIELMSENEHIFFYYLGAQRQLFICEADPVGKATDIFDVGDWLLSL